MSEVQPTPQDSRLNGVLHDLEKYTNDHPEKPSTEESALRSTRATYYEAYDNARDEGLTHGDALEKSSKEQAAYRRAQAKEMRGWVDSHQDMINAGVQAVLDEGHQGTLKTTYTMFVTDGENGPRTQNDVVIATLTTLGRHTKKGANEPVTKLYDETAEAAGRVADGQFFGRELVDKTVGQARDEEGTPISTHLLPEAKITQIDVVGFKPNKMSDAGAVSEAYVEAQVGLVYPD